MGPDIAAPTPVAEARKERDATKLSPESFAVYWLLKQEGVQQADGIARQAEQAFREYPHWQTSTHQEQELRRSFYKALISAGVDGVAYPDHVAEGGA